MYANMYATKAMSKDVHGSTVGNIPNWKQSKCPLTVKWIQILWNIRLYSGTIYIDNNEHMTHVSVDGSHKLPGEQKKPDPVVHIVLLILFI